VHTALLATLTIRETCRNELRRVWSRGVDLNHRPLGYEFNGKLIPNNLHAHG
jgi:hypothetical protein